MNARQLVAGHGEHAKRVIIAQVGFDGEGELCKIRQAVQVVGVYARCVKALAVKGDVRISVVQ